MRTLPFLLAISFFFNNLYSQELRYFEVVQDLPPGSDWRDSAYVVAASDSALLAEIEAELALPVAQRRHVNSPLAPGNGGFNHNAGFWYSWHSIPNEWVFAEISIEVCDGRPYTDVEADTAYWIGSVGRFCGWAYHVAREIGAPVSAPEPADPLAVFMPVLPNPAQEEVQFTWTQQAGASATLGVTDAAGRLAVTLPLGWQEPGEHSKTFATAALADGLYFVSLQIGGTVLAQRLVVAH